MSCLIDPPFVKSLTNYSRTAKWCSFRNQHVFSLCKKPTRHGYFIPTCFQKPAWAMVWEHVFVSETMCWYLNWEINFLFFVEMCHQQIIDKCPWFLIGGKHSLSSNTHMLCSNNSCWWTHIDFEIWFGQNRKSAHPENTPLCTSRTVIHHQLPRRHARCISILLLLLIIIISSSSSTQRSGLWPMGKTHIFNIKVKKHSKTRSVSTTHVP